MRVVIIAFAVFPTAWHVVVEIYVCDWLNVNTPVLD